MHDVMFTYMNIQEMERKIRKQRESDPDELYKDEMWDSLAPVSMPGRIVQSIVSVFRRLKPARQGEAGGCPASVQCAPER